VAEVAAPVLEVSAPVAEPIAEIPAPAPTTEPVVAAPAAAPEPQTIGELLGQAEKANWTPNEIVNGLCAQPTVAGAVVALQEGLVIAHKLPEPFKGEVFAAFLPQIFARLNQYANEMKLGAVNELTIAAEGAPCHLFRRGQVFFAVLGKPDGTAPLNVLRKCADALASQ
jgi:predicted regulator of Ras-like GTPase activity (Roadblock/LC7/MglB family)